MTVRGRTIIGDLLDVEPSCGSVFAAYGMDCADCPSSRGESLEEACGIHGVDADTLLGALRAHLEGKS